MDILEETRYIMKKYNIRANKSLGQNFLINNEVVENIVNSSEISKSDMVIEIGPGLGTLTKYLLEKAGKVLCVELDTKMIKILQDRFGLYDNFELINADILKVNLNEIISENKKEGKSGELTCNYLSKSDAESQTVTYNLRYENEKLLYSEFNYVVVSNLENTSEVVNDLINKYENFYINNSSNTANNITFEKNEKGFTFNVKTDYTKNNIELNEAGSETILYVSPSPSDTYLSLSDSYTNKGFTCSLTTNDKK